MENALLFSRGSARDDDDAEDDDEEEEEEGAEDPSPGVLKERTSLSLSLSLSCCRLGRRGYYTRHGGGEEDPSPGRGGSNGKEESGCCCDDDDDTDGGIDAARSRRVDGGSGEWRGTATATKSLSSRKSGPRRGDDEEEEKDVRCTKVDESDGFSSGPVSNERKKSEPRRDVGTVDASIAKSWSTENAGTEETRGNRRVYVVFTA